MTTGQHISITRYQKTRYWAIWNEVDLLAVTVYRKGAEAILNFITNPNKENTNTMTKTKSAESTTTTATTLQATTAQGETVRVRILSRQAYPYATRLKASGTPMKYTPRRCLN